MSMQFALAVDWIRPSITENLAEVANRATQAAGAGANLVLFSEAALTGFISNDQPEHDFPLCCAIPGEETSYLCETAQRLKIYIGLGVLERDGDTMYDSAILIDPAGDIILTYRRINPCWHGRKADPAIYQQGTELPVASTPFGSVAFLLCGDLFDDEITNRLRNLSPDYLLFPFARSFGDKCLNQTDWERSEEHVYAARAARCNCTALMANQLMDAEDEGDGYFGGAMVVSPKGRVLTRLPLGMPGMLLWKEEPAHL